MRFLLLVSMMMSAPAFAQDDLVFDRFLLPLYGHPVAGAHGSRWGLESWVRYSGTVDTVVVPRLNVCSVTCSAFYLLRPGEAPSMIEPAYAGSSLLLRVEQRLVSEFHFSSRVRDLSRGDGSGTEIPIVHESRMLSGPIYLLNVPLSEGSRNTLRVYALPEIEAPSVEIRYFRMPGDPFDLTARLLRVDRVALSKPPQPIEFEIHPSSATLSDFQLMPELEGEAALWLEIVPHTPGLRIWAMASVTDNVTQRVTLITPSAR